MPPVVARIVERNLDEVFQRAPYVLARVDRAAGAGFHRGVSEYFDFRYPRLFTFGSFGRSEHRSLDSRCGSMGTAPEDRYTLVARSVASSSSAVPGRT